MRFDNTDFEKNVAQSMSTLDKLKQALNFGGAGVSALDGISKAASNVNIGGIGDAIDTVKEKFSALEIAGITALVNITNKAVDAGAQIVKSLTIDQVTAGWDKYAEKTTAVQTIMAATRNEFEDEGEQMEYVNEQLDKLNWFTDETSYNLVDMVSNIGKFTNSGVKLDAAVTSMQGIATWAAISGSNAQEASRAMYNLSQALGAGYVRLIDWKSIENANMATMEFKETAIETGLAMGTLIKYFDETDKQWKIGAANGKEAEVSVQNFASTLTKGEWLTSDVLNAVLDKYGAFTDALNSAYNETGLETINLLQYTEDFAAGLLDLDLVAKETGLDTDRLAEIFTHLNDPMFELGRRAFKAAQETKTFAEVIAYTKDAVSSGWMNTFELIFGDYEEAKAMWSDLSEVFYEIFVASGEARNEMLGAWKELGGRTSMLEAVSNTYEAFVKIIDTVKEAFHDVFPARDSEEKGKALFDFTERVRVFSERLMLTDEAAEKLKNALTPVFTTLKKGIDSVKEIGKIIKSTILDSLKKLIKPLKDLLKAGKDVVKFVFAPLEGVSSKLWQDLVTGFEWLSEGALTAADNFSKWIETITDTIRSTDLLTNKYAVAARDMAASAASFLGSFFSLTETINSFNNGGEGFSGFLQIIADKLLLISNTLVDIFENITGWDLSNIRDGVSGFISDVQNALGDFGSAIEAAISDDVSPITNLGNAVEAGMLYLEKKITEATGFDFTDINNVLYQIPDALKVFKNYIKDVVTGKTNPIEDLGMAIGYGGYLLEQKITEFTGLDFTGFNQTLMKIPDALSDFMAYVKKVIKGEANPFTDLADSIGNGAKELQKKFDLFSGLDTGPFETAIKDIPLHISNFAEYVKRLFSGENPFKTLGKNILEGAETIKTAILAYAGIEYGPFDQKTEEMIQRIDAFVDHFDGFFKLIKGIWDLLGSLAQLVEPVAGLIGEIFSAIAERISEAAAKLENVEGSDVLDRFMEMIGGFFEFIKSINFGEVLGMIRDIGLAAMGFEIAQFFTIIVKAVKDIGGGEGAAESIKSIATAILEIIAAILLVNTMSEEEVESATNIIIGIVGFIFTFSEVSAALGGLNLGGAKKLSSLAAVMGSLALTVVACVASILLMKNAMKEGTEGMAAAVSAVALMLFSIAGSVLLIGMVDAKKLAGAAAVIFAIGTTVKKLVKCVEALQELPDGWESAALGVEALLISLGGIVALIGAVGNEGGMIAGAAALLAMSASLAILVEIVKTMNSIGSGNIWEPLAQLGLALAGMTVALKVLADPLVLAGAAAIAVVAAGLLILAQALVMMSESEGTWEALAQLGLALAGISAAAILLTPVMPTLLALAAVFASIGVAAVGVGTGVLLMAEAFAVFVDALEKGYPLFKQIAADIGELVGKLVGWFLEKIDEVWKSIGKFFGDIGKSIGKFFSDIWKSITDFFSKAWKNISKFFSDTWKSITDFFSQTGEKIGKFFSDIWKSITTFFSDVWKSITEAVAKFWKGVTDFFSEFWDSITGFFADIGESIATAVSNFLEKGKELILNLKKGAEEKFQSVIDSVVGFFGNLKTEIGKKIEEFINIGKNIIDGIKQGISDAWTGFTDWTSGLFDGLVKGWNSFWGINSPSKLTAEMGGYIVDGLTVGIKDELPALKDAVKDVNTAIKDGLSVDDNIVVDSVDSALDKYGKWAFADKWELAVASENSLLSGEEFKDSVKDAFKDVPLDGSRLAESVDESLNKYGKWAFARKSEIGQGQFAKSIDENLNKLGKWAYASKSEIAEGKFAQTVDENLNKLGKWAFASKSEMASGQFAQTVDESINKLGKWAFASKSEIAEGKFVSAIDESLNKYGKWAFTSKSEMAEAMKETTTVKTEEPEWPELADEKWSTATTELNKSLDTKATEIQNVLKVDHSDVIASIESVKAEVKTLKNSIYEMKLVLDSGALVGGIIDNIDKELGKRSILAGRGV